MLNFAKLAYERIQLSQLRIQDFPLGGRGCQPVGEGRPPLTWMLFGKNMCEVGVGGPVAPPGSANVSIQTAIRVVSTVVTILRRNQRFYFHLHYSISFIYLVG